MENVSKNHNFLYAVTSKRRVAQTQVSILNESSSQGLWRKGNQIGQHTTGEPSYTGAEKVFESS